MTTEQRAGNVRRRVTLFFASKRLSQLRVQAAHRSLEAIRREYTGYRESNILLRRQIEEQDKVLRRVLIVTDDEILTGMVQQVLLEDEPETRVQSLRDALTDVTRTVINESEGHTFGKPGYDMTLDHLHDVAVVAREALYDD